MIKLFPVPFREIFECENLRFLKKKFHSCFELLLIEINISKLAFIDFYFWNPNTTIAIVYKKIQYQIRKIISRKVIEDLSLFVKNLWISFT